MKLYGPRLSPFVRKVLIVLEEKNAKYEHDLFAGRKTNPLYEKLNPAKTVPILEIDSGVVFWESAVINEYLEETIPSPRLLPASPEEKAVARAWEAFSGNHLAAGFRGLFRAKLVWGPKGPEPRNPAEIDPQAVADGEAALAVQLDRLEKRLADRDWLAGAGRGEYTLADIAQAPFLLGAKPILGVDPTAGRPRLADWFQRLTARPAVQKGARVEP